MSTLKATNIQNASSANANITLDTSGGIALPTLTGIVKANGASSLTAAVRGTDYSLITEATAVASTSGTSVSFTGLPAGILRITIMLQGVSTAAANTLQVVLGTGGTPTYTTSGYAGGMSAGNNAIATTAMSTGFDICLTGAATGTVQAQIVLTNLTGNTWMMSGISQLSNTTAYAFSSGSVALAAALTAVRVSGGTFDAGTINILYEY